MLQLLRPLTLLGAFNPDTAGSEAPPADPVPVDSASTSAEPLPVPSTVQLMALARRLLEHAEQGSASLAQRMDEMDQRSSTLKIALDAAESQMQQSLRSAEALEGEIATGVRDTQRHIGEGLARIDGELTRRLAETTQIVSLIEGIANELNLLAINAAIEAAHAERHGATFGVVAERIRELAGSTRSHAQRIKEQLEFNDLHEALERFQQDTGDTLGVLADSTSASTRRQLGNFQHMHAHLESVRDNNKVIFEVLGQSQSAVERVAGKTRWSRSLLAEGTTALEQGGEPALTRLLQDRDLLRAPDFDRLAEIRRRGVLRVAIEPDFKGLSFRRRPGDPLQGLDADYARAFARWLGVECQFLECPWDQCTELLAAGRAPGEPEADLVWSALPPNASYRDVAFSESYTYLPYALARRKGDTRISGIADLEGRVLGCINDPAAFDTLAGAGLRWPANQDQPGGRVRLANLVAYSDQGRIHDCLADGLVDAFAVDRPIYWWACYGEDSPWRGQIELLPAPISASPWYYAAGVSAEPSGYHLLAALNRFIGEFRGSPERRAIEQRWEGQVLDGTQSYRQEPGDLPGETELRERYLDHCQRLGIEPRTAEDADPRRLST